MSIYLIARYIHMAAALGMVVAVGLEWVSLYWVRGAATAEQARNRLRPFRWVGRVGMPAMLAILVTGLYMMATVWRGAPWIFVALGAVVLLGVLAMAIVARRVAAIGQAASGASGPMSPRLNQALHSPALWVAIHLRVAILVGILYLMNAKPDLVGALLAMLAAVVVGLASVLPVLGQARAQEDPAM